MATPKSSEKSTKRKRGNPQNLKPWEPGQSGNPAGKKPGTRDRRTVIWAAIQRIAEAKKTTPEEIEDAIQAAGIEKALKGSFFHYDLVSNGLYGKVQDKLDVTSGGKTLADVIAAASHARRQQQGGRKKS
jgi:hypothetical protein